MATRSVYAGRRRAASEGWLVSRFNAALTSVSNALIWLLAASWPTKGAVAAAAVTVPLAFFWLLGKVERSKAAEPLPASLEQRATLFAKAWGSRNLAAMTAFVKSDQKRVLQRWSSSSARPAAFVDLESGDLTVNDLKIEPVKDEDRSNVTLKVECAPGPTNKDAAEYQSLLRQVWEKSGSNWYFSPSASAEPAANTRSGGGVVVSQKSRHF